MPLPFILALAGLLGGAAFGGYGGARLGAWLKGQLSDEEQKAVRSALRTVGVSTETDLAKLPESPERKKREVVDALETVRSKSKGKKKPKG